MRTTKTRYWGGEFGDPLNFNPDRFSPEASRRDFSTFFQEVPRFCFSFLKYHVYGVYSFIQSCSILCGIARGLHGFSWKPEIQRLEVYRHSAASHLFLLCCPILISSGIVIVSVSYSSLSL